MKILVKYAEVEVYVDDYEKGETDFVNSWVLESLANRTFENAGLLAKAVNNACYAFSDKIEDYVYIDGRIDTDAFVNAENEEPTQNEIEAWKTGKATLYNAHLFIGLAIVPDECERGFTEADAEKYGVNIC